VTKPTHLGVKRRWRLDSPTGDETQYSALKFRRFPGQLVAGGGRSRIVIRGSLEGENDGFRSDDAFLARAEDVAATLGTPVSCFGSRRRPGAA
jgi:hypothetical protein